MEAAQAARRRFDAAARERGDRTDLARARRDRVRAEAVDRARQRAERLGAGLDRVHRRREREREERPRQAGPRYLHLGYDDELDTPPAGWDPARRRSDDAKPGRDDDDYAERSWLS